MAAVFLKLLNMSITAGWITLAVIALRLLLKKAPKWIIVLMWALVGIRLICPISPESALSLIPSAQTVPDNILYANPPEIHSGIEVFNSAVNPVISESLAPKAGDSMNPMQAVTFAASVLWASGAAAMLAYTAVSYLKIRKKVSESVPFRDNIRLCDHVNTPFILGIVRPQIYLPSSIGEQDINYVIAHEQAHLKRRDHWWKPLGFLLLSVYWFHPILWLAYVLLCRDIEFACDEKVIREMGTDKKKPYSDALINCSVPRRMIAACPLAFGEAGVKSRVKSVLSYRKPAFWIIAAAVIACAAAAVCFLTNPPTQVDETLTAFLDARITAHHQSEKSKERFCCLDWEVIGKETSGNRTTLYLWVLYEEFSNEGELTVETGSHVLTVITVAQTDRGYRLVEYWEPKDGADYAASIKEKVPLRFRSKALDSQRYIDQQSAALEQMAREYFIRSSSVTDGVPLTLEDVIALSRKGDALTWADFAPYAHRDVGSGMYICRYEIDEMFSLEIGSPHPDAEAQYFILCANNYPFSPEIDIRLPGVEEFIDEHKDNPVVRQVFCGYDACPVALGDTQISPMVRIGSTKDLQDFIDSMSPTTDFDVSYPDAPSFNRVSRKYDDEYFRHSTLFLIPLSAETTASRFFVDYVTKTFTKTLRILTIVIGEAAAETGESAEQEWLMCVSVPNSDLSDVNTITIQAPDQKTTSPSFRLYVYSASSDELSRPCITLFDDGTFSFSFSVLSSYISFGRYTLENNRLTLIDGKYTYCFDVVNDTLVFDAEASSDIPWASSDIRDGAVFE